MNIGKKSLIATSIISYGIPGIYCCIYGNDQIFGYYSLFLAFFSGLYHYYDELNYFAEDFICSFFIKYHVFLNYIWWLTWGDFLKYIFLMDIFGHLIFYYSVRTWETKCISHDYYWVHNIWHLFTGGLASYVVFNEKLVEMGNWNIFYMLCFVFIMTKYNLKRCIFQKHLILSTFYLWNLSNVYNIISLLFYYVLQQFFSE
jgi:hypothetical protein